jgi:hypothetical protein
MHATPAERALGMFGHHNSERISIIGRLCGGPPTRMIGTPQEHARSIQATVPGGAELWQERCVNRQIQQYSADCYSRYLSGNSSFRNPSMRLILSSIDLSLSEIS